MLACPQAVEDVLAIDVSVLKYYALVHMHAQHVLIYVYIYIYAPKDAFRQRPRGKKIYYITQPTVYCVAPTCHTTTRVSVGEEKNGKHAQNSVVLGQCLNAFFK